MTDENLRSRTWSPRTLLLVGVAVAVAFLVGFLWQWLEARGARAERDDLAVELAFEDLEGRLAAALILVDNESYESGRELMSRFFTGLQTELDRAPADAQDELRQILSQRDATITALSRSDPGSEEALQRLYTRYQVAMGGPEVGIPVVDPAAADTAPADTGPGGG